ncbi:glycosyltransferase family 39 protein [Candidatus Gottesmanbacteria bacterium]|nr:glycosyltransferase family 39 protein [Candidatus Gottesmanbacteria bacterium]
MHWSSSLKQAIITAAIFTFWMHFVVYMIGSILLGLVKPLPYYLNNMKLVELIPQAKNTGWYTMVHPLQRFDGLWYKEIALQHYFKNPRSTAFFPLYPFTIELIMMATGFSFEQAAFVFNSILLFIFFILIYFLAAQKFHQANPWHSVVIYAFFPTSFFLLAPYADILMLDLILFSLFAAYGKKYFLSSLVAVLVVMTKPFGIFFIIPLIYLFYKSAKSPKLKLMRLSYLLLLPCAFMIVVFYQDLMSGTIASTFKSQSYWGMKFTTPWGIVKDFLHILKTSYSLPTHLNFILAVAGLYLLFISKGVIPNELWIYSFVLYMVFVFTSTKYGSIPFFSFSRYALMLFPLFIYTASIKVQNIIKSFYIGISLLLLVIFFIFYTVGFFVA